MNLEETEKRSEPEENQADNHAAQEIAETGPESRVMESAVPPRRWTPEELHELAKLILQGKSLSEAVEYAFKEHPDLETGVIEVIDEDELKP